MIELLFLGVGAAIPMSGQTNSSFLLRSDEATILIDCGPAIMQQLAAVHVSPATITHLYFTHRHGDHSLGYPMLMLWYVVAAPPGTRCPTLIAGQTTFTSLDALMHGVYGGDIASYSDSAPRVTLPDHAPSTLTLTPGIHLRTWPMRHTEFAPDLGARFEIGKRALAFTGDTFPTPAILDLARDADILVHDSSYSATLNPDYATGVFGHSTAQLSARHAAQANAAHVALVHIDHIYAGQQAVFLEEAQREFTGRVSIPLAGTLYSF
jgi:ribonuclease Z